MGLEWILLVLTGKMFQGPRQVAMLKTEKWPFLKEIFESKQYGVSKMDCVFKVNFKCIAVVRTENENAFRTKPDGSGHVSVKTSCSFPVWIPPAVDGLFHITHDKAFTVIGQAVLNQGFEIFPLQPGSILELIDHEMLEIVTYFFTRTIH